LYSIKKNCSTIKKNSEYLKARPILDAEELLSMTKFEKRLCIVALVFVVVYLGAAAVTIHTRISKNERVERIDATQVTSAEGHLLMAELFLPMVILLTLTICFIVIRKQRAKKMLQLDEPDEKFGDPVG
jgi:hypothetical protein